MEPPATIKTYLTGDLDAIVGTFAPDAVVTDEGHTYRGRDEIRAWRQAVANAFTYTTEITGSRSEGDGRWIVAIHIAGDFPGGVADLEQAFTVDDDGLITALTIA